VPAAGTDRDLPLKIIKSDFKIVGVIYVAGTVYLRRFLRPLLTQPIF
jgi:hypothetical protein